MSTASRNCGTVCSARGRWSNAPEVPGVSGKPGGHNDPRSARQLGAPLRTGPKCDPEVKTVAFASRGSAHNTILPGVEPGSGIPLHFLPSPNPRQILELSHDR
jgi:hypothetical protein